MEIIRRVFGPLAKREYIWLSWLVLVTLILHFLIINQPGEPVFDERYYLKDARLILNGEGVIRPEHPPLGELFITFGLFLFGDTPLGWRFFSIVFGTASIIFFYLVCRQLALSPRASFLATFLLALENQSFIQASIAMLDVFSVTFMLVAFWLYLRGNYPWAGVMVCLSTLTKLNGALTLPVIVLHWLLARRDRPIHFSASMVLAPLLFFLLLPLFDFIITGQLVDPISRITNMLSATGRATFVTAFHPYATRPWEWVLRPQVMPYWYEPFYSATISFTVWALIIPGVLYLAFRVRKDHQAGLFGVLWFAGTYLVWIPLSLITNRVSFVYYFYPTIGAICLGLGLGFSRFLELGKGKKTGKLRWLPLAALSVYLLLHVAIFIALSPLLTQWVPQYRYLSPP